MADILYSKSHEQLLNILFDKANKRKQTQHDATVHQTRDWAATEQALYEMRSQVERLQQQKQEYLDEVQAAVQAEKTIAEEIDGLASAIVAKENDLRQQKTGNNSNKYVEQMREIEVQLTAATLKNLNKLLENDGPEALTAVLEHFVALLRNKAGSKNVDVELFMADLAKLKAKMARTMTNSCSLDVVRPAMAVMKAKAPLFDSLPVKGEADISEYKLFVDWSINFCNAAEIDMKGDELAKEVSDMHH